MQLNLHPSWKIVILVLFPSISLAKEIPVKKIHKFMTKEELGKYFAVDKHEDVPKYEVVNIRMRKRNFAPRGGDDHRIDQRSGGDDLFISSNSIFGESLKMRLSKNRRLTASTLTVMRVNGDTQEQLPLSEENCHYLGANGSTVATFSACQHDVSNGLTGVVMLPAGAVHVQPVDSRLAELLAPWKSPDADIDDPEEKSIPHLISEPSKRLSVQDESELWDDDRYLPPFPRDEYELDDSDIMKHYQNEIDDIDDDDETLPSGDKEELLNDIDKRASKDKNLELGIFFDQDAYEKFMPHVGSEEELRDLILGFVNQMQALYYQPSLKQKIHITVVHMEIMKKQPSDLPHADGERDKLLNSFCDYQAKKNPDSDNDPNHWDMALYVSGLNFYSMEDGKKNGITMGLAPVGGVCVKKHACVIAEFGTVSDDGKPYPSAGLLSTYVAVHEIGHNLGMFHDGPPNNKCPTNGHVMSPSRGTKGETTWSACSADVIKKLNKGCLNDKPGSVTKDQDHSKFKEKPGQVWDAYDQCKVFLRDEDATLYNDTVLELVCEQTLCKTPKRIGYYSAGPALEGTFCGGTKWCQQGKCVSWGKEKPKVVKGGWSDWQKGKCSSGCLTKGRGVQVDRRKCNNPKPQNTEKICEGDNIRIHFCDDSKMCNDRDSPEDYANKRCKAYSEYLSDITPVGVQVKHNEKRQWQACAIYCKLKTGTWYTPRQELNDRGVDTFFPDGTWCHSNEKVDFYCQNRLCLPPAPKGRSMDPESQSPARAGPEIDVDLLNNASPKGDNTAPEKLKEYFKYSEGKIPPPLPGPDELQRPKEEDYEIIDYVSPSL